MWWTNALPLMLIFSEFHLPGIIEISWVIQKIIMWHFGPQFICILVVPNNVHIYILHSDTSILCSTLFANSWHPAPITFLFVLKRVIRLRKILKKGIHCFGGVSHHSASGILLISLSIASLTTVLSSTWCTRKLVSDDILCDTSFSPRARLDFYKDKPSRHFAAGRLVPARLSVRPRKLCPWRDIAILACPPPPTPYKAKNRWPKIAE